MTRVLIVTVGGSPDPILKAVELHHPDEVIFACSAPPCASPSLDQVIGEGTPCRHWVNRQEQWRPNLVTQLGLRGFREDLQLIRLPDPDDLNICLQHLRAFVQSLERRFNQLDLCGDFTGGTKSMSTALAFVLLEAQATLSVVSGPRNNLVRIEKSEGLRIVDPIPLLIQRLLGERLPPLLADHFYDRAGNLLRDFRQDHAQRLAPEQQQTLEALIDQLRVLVLWDRFRWCDALDLAEKHEFAAVWPDLWGWWLRVEAAINWDPTGETAVPITGYELVQDLLLNAERRGRRGWYDDAVARLYRATELLAQTYIRIELRLQNPPDWAQRQLTLASGETFPNTGVSGLYRWLQDYEHRRGLGKGCNGIGTLYSKQCRELLRLFDARNKSLLGHGLRSITLSEWQSLQDRVSNLLNTMLASLAIEQGPQPLQLPSSVWLHQPLVETLRQPKP